MLLLLLFIFIAGVFILIELASPAETVLVYFNGELSVGCLFYKTFVWNFFHINELLDVFHFLNKLGVMRDEPSQVSNWTSDCVD